MLPAIPQLADDLSDAEILTAAAAYVRAPRLEQVTPTILREIALDRGIDFATSVLYDRVRRSQRHQPLIRWMESSEACSVSGEALPQVLIVPALYDPNQLDDAPSGRFIIELAATVGLQAHWLELPPSRTISHASQKVAESVAALSGPVIIVSLSRSSADVKHALAALSLDDRRQRVAGWLSVTGVLKGTPLINELLDGPVSSSLMRGSLRRNGIPETVFEDLVRGPGSLCWAPLAVEAELPIVHLAAFPRRRHLEAMARSKHERRWLWLVRRFKLDRYGPHEGAALLGDLLNEPGEIMPVWGVPHWLCPEWNLDRLIPRALCYLVHRCQMDRTS